MSEKSRREHERALKVKAAKARVAAMTPEELSESARHAARSRWAAMTPEERRAEAMERWKVRRAKAAV